MSDIMLKVNDINVYYGSIHAIKDISFEVRKGQIVTLVGANGAGKSTTLQTISGLLHSKTGSIEFLGKNLAGVAPHKIVEHGLAHVPEGRRVFLQMSVEENLEMGAYTPPLGDRRRYSGRIFTFPASERTPQAGGRYAFGRRTADACHGQSAYVQAAVAYA